MPPFAPGHEHTLLAAFVGAWSGPSELWLDPTKAPELARWDVDAATLLDGRFVRLAYTHTVGGAPYAGELTLAYERDEGRYTAAWIDSFHTGTMLLVSHGREDAGGVTLVGSYPAGEQRWGWTTRLVREGEHLVLFMENVTPDGEASPAVRVRLSRR